MHKISTDQLTLRRGENSVGSKGFFHFAGTRLERPQQVPVPALKIRKNFSQLIVRHLGVEPKNPVDDMVRPRLVGGVELPRFGRWLERAHDDPRRIGAQIESLTVQERGFWHNTSVFAVLPLRDGWFEWGLRKFGHATREKA